MRYSLKTRRRQLRSLKVDQLLSLKADQLMILSVDQLMILSTDQLMSLRAGLPPSRSPRGNGSGRLRSFLASRSHSPGSSLRVEVNIAESFRKTPKVPPATSQLQMMEVKVGLWKDGRHGLKLVKIEVWLSVRKILSKRKRPAFQNREVISGVLVLKRLGVFSITEFGKLGSRLTVSYPNKWL
jgi:hypothetical protein